MSDRDDAAERAKAWLEELMATPEDLDSELEAYREVSDDGWTMIRHPLVYSVVHTPELNAMVNMALKQKREQLADARRSRDWQRWVYLHERPHRVDAFAAICWQLGDKKYWELLADIWVDTENFWQNRQRWRELLTAERRYRSYLMDAEQRAQLKEVLPNPVPVFRGFSAPPGSVDGLSWTTNKIVAKFFASRLAPPGAALYVARGVVRKRDVLAYLDDRRSEYEVVVLPENVRDVEVNKVTRSDVRRHGAAEEGEESEEVRDDPAGRSSGDPVG